MFNEKSYLTQKIKIGIDQDKMAWIGLGSNLGNSSKLLDDALIALKTLTNFPILQSPRYHSPPWGVLDQPVFLNQVIGLIPRMSFTPETLLRALQEIENQHGRQRQKRWGPRTLDLDLLAWGLCQIDSKQLQLPHPRLSERRFVLKPWCDLAPELILPNYSDSLAHLLARCTDQSTLWVAEDKPEQ